MIEQEDTIPGLVTFSDGNGIFCFDTVILNVRDISKVLDVLYWEYFEEDDEFYMPVTDQDN